MVEISQIKDYILKNKTNYSKEKINIQLENNGVSRDIIEKAWSEIQEPKTDNSTIKLDDDLFKEKKKMPISDIISWVVIVLVLIFCYFYFF